MTTWQKIRLGAAVLILVALSIAGCIGYTDELRAVDGLARGIQVAAQLAYVALGFASALALFLKPSAGRILLYAWGLALVVTGVLAPAAWGKAPWLAGMFVGAIFAVIAAIVIILARMPAPKG
jgi:hypothetical protein